MPYSKVVWVVDNEYETRFSKFKMANLIWPSLYLKMFQALYNSGNLKKPYPRVFLHIDNEYESTRLKFNMADSIG